MRFFPACFFTLLVFRQRYVARPLLWRGRKFHFRAYAAVRADMSAWLYRTAYILCASKPYSLGEATAEGVQAGLTDELMHISNLAVNKHTEGHPGQVSPIDPLEPVRSIRRNQSDRSVEISLTDPSKSVDSI